MLADPGSKNEAGVIAQLKSAINSGDMVKIKQYVAQLQNNWSGVRIGDGLGGGVTPFFYAFTTPSVKFEVRKYFADNNNLIPDVNEKDFLGDTALHYAAGRKLDLNTTKLLLAQPNIDVDKTNNDGKTAYDLVYATQGQSQNKDEILRLINEKSLENSRREIQQLNKQFSAPSVASLVARTIAPRNPPSASGPSSSTSASTSSHGSSRSSADPFSLPKSTGPYPPPFLAASQASSQLENKDEEIDRDIQYNNKISGELTGVVDSLRGQLARKNLRAEWIGIYNQLKQQREQLQDAEGYLLQNKHGKTEKAITKQLGQTKNEWLAFDNRIFFDCKGDNFAFLETKFAAALKEITAQVSTAQAEVAEMEKSKTTAATPFATKYIPS